MTYRDGRSALEMRQASLRRELAELRATAQKTAARTAECEAELSSVGEALGTPKRALPSLDAAKVASPCDVPWADMRGDERVRHCTVCSKNVYNLSAMSRADAEALLLEGGDICTRFYRRADGTVLTADCPMGARGRPVLVAALTALAGASVAVGVSTVTLPPVHTVPVGRLVSEAAGFKGRPVRVEGTLVAGSLARLEGPCGYRFRLSGDGAELAVHLSQCVLPDTFVDTPAREPSILIEGALKADLSFEATSAIARGVNQGYLMRPSRAGRSAEQPGENEADGAAQ